MFLNVLLCIILFWSVVVPLGVLVVMCIYVRDLAKMVQDAPLNRPSQVSACSRDWLPGDHGEFNSMQFDSPADLDKFAQRLHAMGLTPNRTGMPTYPRSNEHAPWPASDYTDQGYYEETR